MGSPAQGYLRGAKIIPTLVEVSDIRCSCVCASENKKRLTLWNIVNRLKFVTQIRRHYGTGFHPRGLREEPNGDRFADKRLIPTISGGIYSSTSQGDQLQRESPDWILKRDATNEIEDQTSELRIGTLEAFPQRLGTIRCSATAPSKHHVNLTENSLSKELRY